MDIQWLLTFDKILQVGTFAKAADELGYTQSTVTFQIRQLEQELSIKLFDKIGRKMQLSEAGRAIVPMVRETIEASERLKLAGRKSNGLAGNLTIAASASIFKITPIYDVVARFLKEAPQVKLAVTRKVCNAAVEGLKDGTIDIGILYQVDGREDPALDITRLQDIQMVLIASGKMNTGWDLKRFSEERTSLFLTEPGCCFHGVYKRYLKPRGIPYNHEMILNDWDHSLRGIEDGMGISLVARESVEEELAAGSVRIVPTEDLRETAYLSLALHKNKGRSPAIDLFTQLYVDSFR